MREEDKGWGKKVGRERVRERERKRGCQLPVCV